MRSALRGMPKWRRMNFFGYQCLLIAGKYQKAGDAKNTARMCQRADHFFEQSESCRVGAA